MEVHVHDMMNNVIRMRSTTESWEGLKAGLTTES